MTKSYFHHPSPTISTPTTTSILFVRPHDNQPPKNQIHRFASQLATMSSFLFRRSATASTSAARAAFSTTSPRAVARLSIVGNLGDTPELRTSANGNEYVRYSVASNTGPRDNRHTSWFSVAAFVEGGRRDFLLSLAKGYVFCPLGMARCARVHRPTMDECWDGLFAGYFELQKS